MLAAPQTTFTTKYDLTHLNNAHNIHRNKQTLTSRLSTWKQIKPFIYKSMINSDKSNHEWLQNELSSFEQLLRKEYPKDVVPIIMDDHIRSVFSKYGTDSLHKSILKMLFKSIPKLKPPTLFIIPSTPKHKKYQYKHEHNREKTPSFTPQFDSPSLSPMQTPIIKSNPSDSLINSASSASDDDEDNKQQQQQPPKSKRNHSNSHHYHQKQNTLSTKLKYNHGSDSNHFGDRHASGSSISDSNRLFSPEFKYQKHIGLNLTGDDVLSHNGNSSQSFNGHKMGVSPSGSSMIDGFDYHQDINSDDDDLDEMEEQDIIINTMDNIDHDDDTDENETNYNDEQYGDQTTPNKNTDSSEYNLNTDYNINDKIIDSTDDDTNGEDTNNNNDKSRKGSKNRNKKNSKRSSSKSNNFVFNIFQSRKSTDKNHKKHNKMDGNDSPNTNLNENHRMKRKKLRNIESGSNQSKILNSVDTTHLANRISDIQNRQHKFQIHGRSRLGSDADSNASSRPSPIAETTAYEIDIEMHEIHKEISSQHDNIPYYSTTLYIFLYLINLYNYFTSIWLLINMTLKSLQPEIESRLPLFMLIMLYFNVSMFLVLQIWQLFAAILLNMESPNRPKLHKLNQSMHWRLQFWTFLPFIWLKHKSSHRLFYTLMPTPIEIWFDLCIHHIWMLLLCIAFLIYPSYSSISLNNNVYQLSNIDFISSIMYIISFCLMSIVIFLKLKANIFSKP